MTTLLILAAIIWQATGTPFSFQASGGGEFNITVSSGSQSAPEPTGIGTFAPAPTPGQALKNIFDSQANKAGVTEYELPQGRENAKVCRDDRLKCVNP